MTMPTSPTGSGEPTRLSRASAWFACAIAALVAAQGLFLLFLGFDESNFAEAVGIEWEQFQASNPDAAAHLSQGSDVRMFAITTLGLGLQTAALLYLGIRRRQSTRRLLLFILPAVLIGWGVILLPANQNSIAIPSLTVGILTAFAITIAKSTLQPIHPAP